MDKAFYQGTHRVRSPDQTLAGITPLLLQYGITRLADVTGLDTLGVPVVLAHRPLGLTLTVTQGKGATMPAALVSAAMEAIEIWHGEHAVPPAVHTGPAAGLDLDYLPGELALPPGSLVTARTVLDWIGAVTWDGRRSLVPREMVRLGRLSGSEWRCHLLTGGSTGLASGNTRAEAVAHALFELIERDAFAAVRRADAVDLATVPDWCADLAGRIEAGGGHLQVYAVPSRFRVPCFTAYLSSEGTSWTAGGAGAHASAAVAFSRAVTEACQSQLMCITGTRDDISVRAYRSPATSVPPPPGATGQAPWDEVTAGLGWDSGTDDGDAAEAARRVIAITGRTPLIVDLADRPEFAVVRVVAPGMAEYSPHNLPFPGQDAA
jgi:ribosomal protein S12 methylthiotransferase accessory factor